MAIGKTIISAVLIMTVTNPALAAVCDATPEGLYTRACLLETAAQKRVQGMQIMCEALSGVFYVDGGSCRLPDLDPDLGNSAVMSTADVGIAESPGEFVVTNGLGAADPSLTDVIDALEGIQRAMDQNVQIMDRMNIEMSGETR